MVPTKQARPRIRYPAAGKALCVIAALALVTACGQTSVRPLARTSGANLPRPARIVIQHFTANDANIIEYQGILRQQPAERSPFQRRRLLAKNVSEALTANLLKELNGLGFAVDRAHRSKPAENNDLLIEGQFLTVDEGSPWRRLLVGFGSGASKVETRVQVYQGPRRYKVLEFATRADSGKMPGAAATLPAGAAVPGALSGEMAAGGAIITGLRVRREEVAYMAGESAEQAARYLSEFFAQQGWIGANQVKKARIF